VKINEHFLAQMREATQLLQTSGPGAATAAIQRALHGASMPDIATPNTVRPTPAPQSDVLIDINPAPAAHADTASESAAGVLKRFHNLRRSDGMDAPAAPAAKDVDVDDASLVVEETRTGRFLSASCSNQAGTRAYKLYVPSAYDGQALPLIVMLHGCKQNPDDFAAGTGMNLVAEQNNCFVAYPAQARAANGSNCWNWFNASDQQRDRGEPSIIADITRAIIRDYHIDPSRVYVAGLSAGGAMAAIMGATYPELYAAVGIHSGLPYGAAHDLPSAFAAMHNGMAGVTGKPAAMRSEPIPVIVFHGDRDTTVHVRNAEQAIAQCTAGTAQDRTAAKVEQGKVPQGHAYTRTIQHGGNGKAVAEQWIVHGAGHAWSGGSRKGSYTDPKGPDAAQEMARFFATHAKAGQ
jgi:poly(hydroxyalkanoate) depolymerase family esterase